MSLKDEVVISKFEFDSDLREGFKDKHYTKDLWPVVYILSNGSEKQAYIGETTDVFSRMESHLKHEKKAQLTEVHIITGEKFNKSAALDIESNLIKYISADGRYKLINANIGLANHNYYQKQEVYWNIFLLIWQKLRGEGLTIHSIEYLNNSDLFKYSPYKSLTSDQKVSLLTIINNLLNDNFKNILIEGGAGTGKTILAIFLFKLLHTDLQDFSFHNFGDEKEELIEKVLRLKDKYPNPKMALVVPMSSFRNTLKKVFKNVKGLNAKMVIGPAEIVKDDFDIVVVDEAHRLRRRVNLGTYFGAFDTVCEKLQIDPNNCSELDWMIKQTKKLVLFYDENQSIKPSDARKSSFQHLKINGTTKVEKLRSQFRVKGGNDYVQYIHKLLNCTIENTDKIFNVDTYEFKLFDSIDTMVKEIKQRNNEYGLSRLVAGYSWEWISKKDKDAFDIIIEDTKLKWNSVADDWVNSDDSINEVGCIHTTQGYDLNYAGIIFGNEISYDKDKNEIIIRKDQYFDRNGKLSIKDPEELKAFIINIYKTIMLRGIKGTYIYACDKNLQDYLAKHIIAFTKFHTENEHEESPFLETKEVQPYLNSIPVYDLAAAAGDFSELQNVSNSNWIKIPSRYKPSITLFACKVIGESMNKIIPNGSICLFRKYSGGSRNGKIVLVEHTSIQDKEFGSGYTVKEYHSTKRIEDDDQWGHETITLKPLTITPGYQNIEIVSDELSSLKVIGTFECVLWHP